MEGDVIVNVHKFIMNFIEATKMKTKVVDMVLFDLILITFAFAQNPQYPSLLAVRVHSVIMYHTDEKMFYYAYTLTNDTANTGSIAELAIDISRHLASLDIDTVGLRFINNGYTEASFRRTFVQLKGRIVPVGFLKTPGRTWTADLSFDLTACFGGVGDDVIRPGKSSKVFEMMSKGLPAIRRCVVSPYFDFDSLFSEERFPNEDDIPNTDSIQIAAKFYSWTIGPIAPPISFNASDWFDILLSYVSKSGSQGWIATQAVVDKYSGYINRAKFQLQESNNAGARATLQTVLRDVNVDSSSFISSEAYALLRYNTEYLLAQLPAPPPLINVLTPSSAIAGSGSLKLSVLGSDFVAGSVVNWNGSTRSTTFVSESKLEATILASDILTTGTASVTVLNPGNVVSNSTLFIFKLPPPFISALTPAKVQVGSSAFTLNVGGANFVTGAKVLWNGLERSTTFKSAKEVVGQILTPDVSKVDSPLVTVRNPDGSLSDAIRFKVFKTVAMLLSDLRTLLAQSYSKGLIGDANFDKELDNGLDNAQKHLSKPDSVNCFKEVATFQDKVNKEYLRTADNDKKGVHRDKRFVTKDGWALLYNAAQEIMDRLPSKK
jgi:hypothetical protein